MKQELGSHPDGGHISYGVTLKPAYKECVHGQNHLDCSCVGDSDKLSHSVPPAGVPSSAGTDAVTLGERNKVGVLHVGTMLCENANCRHQIQAHPRLKRTHVFRHPYAH